jgi:ubiquinone/menaquinone biosynthesis C-methylase UbiE
MEKTSTKFDYQSHYERDASRINMLTEFSPWRQYRDRRRFQVILDSLPNKNGLKLLDVGCGDGAFLELAASQGLEVSGLEISASRVSRANRFLRSKNISVEVAVGDVNKIPFANGALDAVVASEVIEHTLDPHRALKELARVTKPGGTVLITVPYRENLTFEQCVHCGKFTPKAGHLHSFDEAKSKKLFQSVGLKNVTFRLLVPRMTPFWKVGRRLPYFIWRFFDKFWVYLGNKIDLTPFKANWLLVRGEK